ncbi:MAG: hypothetical protein H0V19_06805 [Euzebyales bacterium]|nr:hypothetical protein [Euzebyales bacterium]
MASSPGPETFGELLFTLFFGRVWVLTGGIGLFTWMLSLSPARVAVLPVRRAAHHGCSRVPTSPASGHGHSAGAAAAGRRGIPAHSRTGGRA